MQKQCQKNPLCLGAVEEDAIGGRKWIFLLFFLFRQRGEPIKVIQREMVAGSPTSPWHTAPECRPMFCLQTDTTACLEYPFMSFETNDG